MIRFHGSYFDRMIYERGRQRMANESITIRLCIADWTL